MRRAGQIAIAVIITVSVGLNVLGALSFSDSRSAAPEKSRAPPVAAVADEDVRMLTRFLAKELREEAVDAATTSNCCQAHVCGQCSSAAN